MLEGLNTKVENDAIDVEVNEGLLAFGAQEEGAVLVVVHEKVFGEDGRAGGVAEEVEVFLEVGVGVGVVGSASVAGEMGLGGGVEGGGEGIGSGVATGGVYELSAVFHLCEQAVQPLIAIGLCVRTSITVPAGVKKGDQWRSQLSGFWGVEPFQSSK